MNKSKYSVGDRVKIKSKAELEEHEGIVTCMYKYAGNEGNITKIDRDGHFHLDTTENWFWGDNDVDPVYIQVNKEDIEGKFAFKGFDEEIEFLYNQLLDAANRDYNHLKLAKKMVPYDDIPHTIQSDQVKAVLKQICITFVAIKHVLREKGVL